MNTAVPEVHLHEIKVAYSDAVIRAGGLPIILACSSDRNVIEAYLERISGLIVSGGAFDVPPSSYGEEVRPGMGPVKQTRTQFESLLIKEAIRRKIPVLGVCGGMQLLNVIQGGTLFQDILLEIKDAKNHEQIIDRRQPVHPVVVKKGTRLAHAVGEGQLMVNSTHHQSVNQLGQGLQTSAVSPDGVVEAIEGTGESYLLGIQWHPELLVDTVPIQIGIYRALVQHAREQRR